MTDFKKGDETRLTVSRKPSNLANIREFIRSETTKLGLSSRAVFDIQVAVGEAAANAMEYGQGTRVELFYVLDNDNLKITVINEGPFKRRIPSPQKAGYRGRGILLMLALMDKVVIDELEDRVRVTLTKKLPTNGN